MPKIAQLEKILSGIANDDKQAFDELYGLYYGKLYAYSRTFLKIDLGIDDILQDVFVKVWMNRHNIKNVDTYNAFLYTITRNTLLNEMRARLKTESFKTNLFNKTVAEEFHTIQNIEYVEIKNQIDLIVAQLPEKRRQVYLLSREECKSNIEIATELNISVKTVEDHMTHALRFLKNRLKVLGLSFFLFCYFFL